MKSFSTMNPFRHLYIVLGFALLASFSVFAQEGVSTSPTATTQSASSVSYYRATLNASVTSNGSEGGEGDTVVSFEYGLTDSYGTSVSATPGTIAAAYGNSPQSVTRDISELLPNTEYHFRVVAINDFGTTYGDDMTFMTLAVAPEINVQGNGNSISDGDLSPTSTDLTDFGTTSVVSGFVARSFTIQNIGTATLELDGTPLVSISGTHSSDFSVTVQPSLSTIPVGSSTSFSVKFDPSAVGVRTAEISISNDDSDENPYNFSIQGTGTNTTSPTATTETASSIGAYSATLNGTVNDNGNTTTVSFEYGLTNAYGSTVSFGEIDERSASIDASVGKSITGLTPLTEYHYRVVATNDFGTTSGNDLTFTTVAAVSEMNIRHQDGYDLADSGFTNVDYGSTAVTGGTIDRTYTIQNTGTGNLLLTGTPIVAISGAHLTDFSVTSQPASTTIAPGGSTTFTVRFDPTANGTRLADLSIDNNDSNENPYGFKVYGTGITPVAPTATTVAALPVGSITATLNGFVAENGAATTVTFEYGLTDSYGTTVNANAYSLAPDSGASHFVELNGLTGGTEYHYRVVATNANGTTNGADMTFTTSSLPPVVLSIADSSLSYTENDVAKQVDASAALTAGLGETEWDGGVLNVQITAGAESADELSIPDNVVGTINTLGLDLRNGSTVIGTLNASEGTVTAGTQLTITFNGNANRVYIEQVLRGIHYRNTSDDPSTSDRTVSFQITNAYSLTDSDTRTIDVDSENDDPTIPTNLGLTLNEGATGGISTAKLSAADDDNSDSELTFTVTTGLINGQLENTDAAGTPISSFTQQNLVDGKIVYVHDDTDTTSDRFIFTLSDGVASLTNITFSIVVNAQPDLPSATTNAASGVSGSNATLNGTVGDNDAETSVKFQYGTTISYGSEIVADQSPIASGTGSTSVSKALSGLLSGTTYHYRVVATNSVGTTEGSDMTFSAPSFPPAGQANNIGFSTTSHDSTTVSWVRGDGVSCVVFVKLDSVGAAVPVDSQTYSANSVFGSGSQIASSGWYCVYNGTGTSVVLSGLNGNTTYRAQVFEYNGVGGSELYNRNVGTGNPANVSTLLQLPTATTLAASSVASGQAVLNGSVDDNNGETTVKFEYGTSVSYGSEIVVDQSPIAAGSGTTSVSKTLTGLVSGTSYHYRVVATNSTGTIVGSDMTFSMPEFQPMIQAQSIVFSATSASDTSVQWSRGDGANCIVFIKESSTGSTMPVDNQTYNASTIFGIGSEIGNTGWFCVYNGAGNSVGISGLNGNTNYRAQVFEYNGVGGLERYNTNVGTGNPANVLTLLLRPSATTEAPSGVSYSGATFHGTVNDNGGDTKVKFEYGLDRNYGQKIVPSPSSIAAGSGNTKVSAILTSLTRNMTYHYRVVATNDTDTTYGKDQTVTIVSDSDEDVIEDDLDFDDDNDGIPDFYDQFPLDGSENVDSDSDGIGNNADTDDDNDGVPDAQDAFPLDPTESVDSDGDGIGDNSDPEPFIALDTDSDGIPDNIDPDDDNDGVADERDAFPLDVNEAADLDFDGIGDNADTDDDGDGVLDESDAFPMNPLEWSDRDGDGVGDNSDAFPDDATETLDSDGDGIGDNADPDADNDGVLDDSDAFPLDATESIDSDGDGVGNNKDLWPNDPAEALDSDGDGVGDNSDPDADNDGIINIYDAYPLDPNYKLDTDSDGYPDNNDQFPTNPFEHNDNDFDGIGDNYDPDDDNDGIPDAEDPYPFSPTQSPLIIGKGYNVFGDTNTYHSFILASDGLFTSQALSFELLSSLPEGMDWNPETGIVSGVIKTSGKPIIHALVNDGEIFVHIFYFLNIVDPVMNPVFTGVETNSVMQSINLLKPSGFLNLGQSEAIQLQLTKGNEGTIQFFTDSRPLNTYFALMSGSLPSGMKLDSSTGVLSGTPSEVSSTTFVLYLLSWKGWAFQEVQIEVTESLVP